VSEHAAVLFANDAFYLAFSSRDMTAMDEVWAQPEPVTCIHPGWSVISGRDSVMQSWRAILGNPNAPDIDCISAEAHVLGDVAYVVCYEVVSSATLAATNVFARHNGHWKMIHHQAGAAPPQPTAEKVVEPVQ